MSFQADHQFIWKELLPLLLSRMMLFYLAVDEGGDGEVPGGVGGHAEAEEGPYPVVVERGYEHRGGAAGAEYVRPCPLVQPIVDVVYVATPHQIKDPKLEYTIKQAMRDNDEIGTPREGGIEAKRETDTWRRR